MLPYLEVSRGHSVRIDVPDFDLSPLDGTLHICDGFGNRDRCFGLLIGLQNSRRLVRNLELRKLTAFPDSGLPLWGLPALCGLWFLAYPWSLRVFLALRRASFAWRRSLLGPLLGVTNSYLPRAALAFGFFSFPALLLLA